VKFASIVTAGGQAEETGKLVSVDESVAVQSFAQQVL